WKFFVVVEVHKNSKGNGEEFVDVVCLVGFCADGFRRALVYEFFPNDSLQDFISSADSKPFPWLGNVACTRVR
ncbi:hypothetical protein, partial [Acinetobacter baylyi]|uniref:hypothetical protein n=1 Tax=Acinetobacter baylyi TaxID=202950 RepID=UPI001C0888F7